MFPINVPVCTSPLWHRPDAVTIPPGLNPGDLINVRTPDGKYIAATIPEGMTQGSTFLVEFVSGPPPAPGMTKMSFPANAEKEPDIPVAMPVSC